MTWRASPEERLAMTAAAVAGPVRIRRPSKSTVANPPTWMAPGGSMAPATVVAFHAVTLPWLSVPRTRNAYAWPLVPGKMLVSSVVPPSHGIQAPPSVATWTS